MRDGYFINMGFPMWTRVTRPSAEELRKCMYVLLALSTSIDHPSIPSTEPTKQSNTRTAPRKTRQVQRTSKLTSRNLKTYLLFSSN